MAGKLKRRKKLRKINMGPRNKTEAAKKRVEHHHVTYFLRHPKKEVVHEALREGLTMVEIARWFAEQGWLMGVNEKTFLAYLGTYKRTHPDLSNGGDRDTIDALIHAHRPNTDTLTELNRLLRLQKTRLNVDVGTELSMGKLFNTTVKEIEAAAKILETIAKVKGEIGSGGGDSGHIPAHGVSAGSNDAIRKLREDEAQRDRMNGMAGKLVEALSGIAQKVKA